MNAVSLFERLSSTVYTVEQGSLDREVCSIVYDSRKVSEGCIFFCLPGANFDGHDFAWEAAEKGAAVLVVSKPVKVREDVTVVRMEDTRYGMAFASAAWFGYPAEHLTTIGVTGTKGKTTTTYLVKSMLENAGFKVGLVGTIEVITGDRHIPAGNTTPESYLLQSYFADMVREGCSAVVMEVSSQGLMMHRTQGFVFDYGIFTNMEPDHIGPGEHADFEEYKACKGLLFRQCRHGIVNGDDSHWQEVTKGHTCTLETYGFGEENDLRAERMELIREKGRVGVGFTTAGLLAMKVKMATPGKFSVYNGLAALAICRHFSVTEGRVEPVFVSDKFTLIIDYAHNAMALESLLSTLREYNPGRLVCVFGCGGNRSRLRRYEMGEVSGRLADVTIITSDNPRFEKPEDIIADIVTGMEKTEGEYITITDRKEAIAYAISHGEEGDIIVLAGKGHEDYQEIEGVKYPMDERVLIEEIIWEQHMPM